MDPDACRQRILDAQADCDDEEALYASSDLLWCLRNGGAAPTGMTREEALTWAKRVNNDAKGGLRR